jgi:hypothetical protein
LPKRSVRQQSQTFRPAQVETASPKSKEHPLNEELPRPGFKTGFVCGILLFAISRHVISKLAPEAQAREELEKERDALLRRTPAPLQAPMMKETHLKPPTLTPPTGPIQKESRKEAPERLGRSAPVWPGNMTPRSLFWAGKEESKRPVRGVSNICLVGRDDEDHIKRVVFHTDGQKNPIFPEEISRLTGKSAGTLEQTVLSREVRQARSMGLRTVTGIIMFDAGE